MNTPTSPTAEKKVRLRPSPWDALVVAAVLLLALALFFGLMQRGGGSGALVCTVSQNAAVLDTITLSDTDPVQQKTYGDYTLEIGHGQVRSSRPCANQDCVRTGRIRPRRAEHRVPAGALCSAAHRRRRRQQRFRHCGEMRCRHEI